MERQLPVRYNRKDDIWEIYDLTVALPRSAELSACAIAARAMSSKLGDMKPGPRRDDLVRCIGLLRTGHVRQVMRSKGELTLVDVPLPDHAKTPFSDLGKVH